MFAQCGENGDDEGEQKYKKQKNRINIDHITCNICEGKGHYAGNRKFSTHTKPKEDARAFIKMKQVKSRTRPLIEEEI